MANLEVKIAAHHNVDSNVVKVQVYVVSACDDYFHPADVLSGEVQLYNVYTTAKTGLVEVALEKVTFTKAEANQDGYFAIFFINPAISTNLEARATLDLAGQGSTTTVTAVLNEEGTFSDTPQHSVVGNATNRSWHLDKEKERDEPYQDVSPHTPMELGENQVVIPEPTIVNSVWTDIQFERLAEVKSDAQLNGDLVYIGGGGRLLPKPGSLSFQPIDTPPWELGTSTFTEQGSVQLLPNNTYTGSTIPCGSGFFPGGYTMDSPGITIIKSGVQQLQGDGFDANAWNIQVNGASPVSISPYSVASFGLAEPLAFDTSKPIALSLLAGMEKVAPDSDITEVKLILNFFDFADRALPSKSIDLDPTDLFNARPLAPFSIQAQPSEFPASTEKFTWRLEIGSVNQGDYVTVRTALPSVTYTPFATSQVLSEQVRVSDNLSFVPDEPFTLLDGAAVFSLAIGFEGTPTEPKWVFDTRESVGLTSGVALLVNADGTLTLFVQNATETTSVSTPAAPAWVSGKVTEIVAEWRTAPALLRISVDGTTLIEDAATALPDMEGILATSLQLGADKQVSGSLDSEFVRAVFLKRPRS
jgi:hypothetical protein